MPWLAPFKPNGKPLHVLGFLARFERVAARTAAMLNGLAATGVPLVGLDPSMTLVFRAEYAKSPGVEKAPDVMLPQEWLASHLDDLPQLEASARRRGSCCRIAPNALTPPRPPPTGSVFAVTGVDLRVLPSGCCGMAGLYGHEAANRRMSEAIYASSWGAHVADARYAGRLLATGYSCRSQVMQIDGLALRHPVQALLSRLGGGHRRVGARSTNATLRSAS